MTNFVPFQGGTGSQDSTYGQSGGYLLPPEQGEILVNGILVETGAIALAGDKRSTTSRKTQFPIWLGQPDAQFVGEGQPKPLTGASFGQTALNIKKVATIIVFTDEMLDDLQNGDLNVLADAGVRQAISKVIDQNAVGLVTAGAAAVPSAFDSTLTGNGGTPVQVGTDTVTNVDDRLQKAVSSAMGKLEGFGYGDPADMGVLLGFGWQQTLRDSRDAHGRPLYDGGTFAGQSIDALYGLDRAHSTALANAGSVNGITASAFAAPNLTVSTSNGVYIGAPVTDGTNTAYVKSITDATHIVLGDASGANYAGSMTFASTKILTPQAVVVHKPNLHVRLRQDVTVATSNEASLPIPTNGPPGSEGGGTSTVSMFVNNLTAVRYETRLGFMIHDGARAVVPIWG